MKLKTKLKTLAAVVAIGVGLGSVETSAHPHVWVGTSAEFLFDDAGMVAAVKVIWRFDDLYSSFAIQGADADKDGVTSHAELVALGRENVKFLKAWNYFTDLRIDGTPLDVGDVAAFDNRDDDGILEFSFTLPFDYPVDPTKHRLRMASFDPSYYVAFEIDAAHPAAATGPVPDGCGVFTYGPDETPKTVSDSLAASMAADKDWAAGFAPKVTVECGG